MDEKNPPAYAKDGDGKLCIINPETGELEPVNVFATPIKHYNAFSGGWLAMSQLALKEIVTNDKMKQNDYRVFLSICSHLDYENYLLIPQKEIAEEIGMAPSHFNRSMKKMVEIGILEVGTKVGRSNSYRLSIQVGWKGTAKNHRKQTDEKAGEAVKKVKKQGSQSDHLKLVK